MNLMTLSPLSGEPNFVIPIEERKIGDDYPDINSASRAFGKVYSLGMKEREKLNRPDLVEIGKYSKKIEDTIDDVLYWDENKNLLYLEAIAIFNDTSEFVRFRNNLPTVLRVAEFNCQVCGHKKWMPRNVDVKVVTDERGKKWKCFSIIFACKLCLSKGRVTERGIKLLGFKYALLKFGRGLKDFLDNVKAVKVSGDLQSQKGSAEIEMGDRKIILKHCPLL
jgi:hypothetical protein